MGFTTKIYADTHKNTYADIASYSVIPLHIYYRIIYNKMTLRSCGSICIQRLCKLLTQGLNMHKIRFQNKHKNPYGWFVCLSRWVYACILTVLAVRWLFFDVCVFFLKLHLWCHISNKCNGFSYGQTSGLKEYQIWKMHNLRGQP